jgi:asparagine synthase (glutamine-hydrolysing)
MCGIAGIVGADRPISAGLLTGLADALEHRGPDDAGFLRWTPDGDVVSSRSPAGESTSAIVHRRLSIIDLSSGGWQPMSSTDGAVHVAFNGEIYNYVELRRELVALGHQFRSTSDTEVLLHGWQEWGDALLPRLIGMFAFAVVDGPKREVVLARDAFGIKPLYYSPTREGFAFASEIPTLLSVPGVSRRVDARGVRDYLQHGLTDGNGQTMFADVHALPAAHLLRVSFAGVPATPQRWWSPPAARDADVSFAEAADHLRSLFVESVALHLRSDVRVGAALSGGIDSSAIVCAMREIGGSSVDLHAFSYVADDPLLSEEKWIRVAAGTADAALWTTGASADELVGDLDRLIETQGEPFGSTSIYAQRRVFALAREHGVTVMLDGQGADEMFAGYRPLVSSRCAALIGRGQVLAAARLARRAGSLPGPFDAKWFLARGLAAHVPPRAVASVRRLLGHDLVPPWVDGDWLAQHDAEMRPTLYKSRSLHDELLQQLTNVSLPGLLRYEERNSMAFSIESRVPFLTIPLVEFVGRLPESYLVDGAGTSKSVLRASLRGLVPDEILERKDKVGFETPERQWLTRLQPWVQQTLADDAAHQVRALRLPEVGSEYAAVRAGRRPFAWQLWRCLNLIRWSESFDVVWDTC